MSRESGAVSVPLKLKPLYAKRTFLTELLAETGVARLDLPAKFRASPLRNVRIVDLLKVAKACLQNPGKIRTSVGGDRREQTHCFHNRHIGGGDLGKQIFFQPGLQRRLRAGDFQTKGTQARPLRFREYPAVGRIKSQSGSDRRNLC